MPDASIEICLLDDDTSQLDATKRVLSSAGWQTRPFTDPDAFLLYARAHAPQIAILDFGGPRAHGLQVRARLREVSPRTRAIISLKPRHGRARDMLSQKELVGLIKQYERTTKRHFFEKRVRPPKRKVESGFSNRK